MSLYTDPITWVWLLGSWGVAHYFGGPAKVRWFSGSLAILGSLIAMAFTEASTARSAMSVYHPSANVFYILIAGTLGYLLSFLGIYLTTQVFLFLFRLLFPRR